MEKERVDMPHRIVVHLLERIISRDAAGLGSDDVLDIVVGAIAVLPVSVVSALCGGGDRVTVQDEERLQEGLAICARLELDGRPVVVHSVASVPGTVVAAADEVHYTESQ